MREFDLSAALAGAPVCTRDGRPVTQLVKFECHDIMSVAGVLDGIVNLWSTNGKSGPEKFDLFMVPVKKTGWVARYTYGGVCGTYETEEKARHEEPKALSYHEISWEE